MLAVVILLAGGVYVYNSLKVELFPDIEFPLVAVNTSYPSVDPEGVVEDVTSPIEKAISGMDGLESVQSTSFEGNSLVLANFKFGTDMANAESNIEAAVSGLSFPVGVERPDVGRFNPDPRSQCSSSASSPNRSPMPIPPASCPRTSPSPRCGRCYSLNWLPSTA